MAICAEGIIDLHFNKKKGFYCAYVSPNNWERCLGCGLCVDTCPVTSGLAYIDSQETSTEDDSQELVNWLIGTHEKVYTGYARDKYFRYECSSGGVATALLKYLFEREKIEAAVVAGPIPSSPMMHRACLVERGEDVTKYRGTVYCQIDNSPTWKFIEERERRLAVIGQPCQLKAIDLFMNVKDVDRSRILKIGLFCGGTSSHRVLKFLCDRKGVKQEAVTKIRYRSGGWPGRRMIVDYDNRDASKYGGKGSVVLFDRDSTLLDRLVYNFCFSGPFFAKACMFCSDQTGECADISLGDAWLPRIMADDRIGSNIIIVRSNEGRDVLDGAIRGQYVNARSVCTEDVIWSQGKCLVGRKLGLWRGPLSRSRLKSVRGKECAQYFPQCVPGLISVLERRGFQELVKHGPAMIAFCLYCTYDLMKISFKKFVRVIMSILPMWS